MARTAYQYTTSLGFANDVVRGMNSLSSRHVSSPLLTEDAPEVPLSTDLAALEVFRPKSDSFDNQSPVGSGEERFGKRRCLNCPTFGSGSATVFPCNSDSNYETSAPNKNTMSLLTLPESFRNGHQYFDCINFDICSPVKVVTSSSIKDFNNNYSNIYSNNYDDENELQRCLKNNSKHSSVSINCSVKRDSSSHFGRKSELIKSEPREFVEARDLEREVKLDVKPYKLQLSKIKLNSSVVKRDRNESGLLSDLVQISDNLVKKEQLERSKELLLEESVSCILKLCRKAADSQHSPAAKNFPESKKGICKSELGSSSHNDTGISSLDTEDEDCVTSEDSSDDKGLYYVSELKGTLQRIKKLSEAANKFKTTLTFPDVGQVIMDFEESIKSVKLQTKDLKIRVSTRNKKLKNSHRWSVSSMNKIV